MKFIDRYFKVLNESLKIRESVKGIVVLDNKKILILRIQEGCGGAGRWDLPGGGIESNETPKEALIREIREETGLRIDESSIVPLNITKKFYCKDTGYKAIWKFYRCNVENTDIQLGPSHWKKLMGQSEHNEIKWISDPSELDNIDMAKEMKDVLSQELRKLWSKNPVNYEKSFF